MEILLVVGILILFALIFLYGAFYIRKFLDWVFPFDIVRRGGSYNDRSADLTYEGQVSELFFPSIISSILLFVFISPINIFGALGFALGILFPSFMLLLRVRTFSDDSILSSTGKGYSPIQSYILSLLAGIFSFIIGFSMLNFDTPHFVAYTMIIMAFIASLIPLLPDKINKFLSYDIRSERGYSFLRKLNAFIIFIEVIIFAFFSIVIL